MIPSADDRARFPWRAMVAMAIALSLCLLTSASMCAAGIEVHDLDGRATLLAGPGQPVGVLVYVCHDCPVCTSYAAEIQRLADRYAARGGAMCVVLEDADFGAAQARTCADEFAIRRPLVVDPDPPL